MNTSEPRASEEEGVRRHFDETLEAIFHHAPPPSPSPNHAAASPPLQSSELSGDNPSRDTLRKSITDAKATNRPVVDAIRDDILNRTPPRRSSSLSRGSYTPYRQLSQRLPRSDIPKDSSMEDSIQLLQYPASVKRSDSMKRGLATQDSFVPGGGDGVRSMSQALTQLSPLSETLASSQGDHPLQAQNGFPPTEYVHPSRSTENGTIDTLPDDSVTSDSNIKSLVPPFSSKREDNRQANGKGKDHGPNPKRYEVFPGNNRFLLGGSLMTGNEYWAFYLVLAILIVPSGLFLGFAGPWLWRDLSPAVVIIFAYLFLICLVSMLKASMTDPGILPRDIDPDPFPDPSITAEYSSFVPMPRETVVKGQMVNLKYCDTCRVYRPPRTSHCRPCDNCVENEDHHCVWLNNCIGRRNYRHFYTCVVSGALLCLYIMAFCLAEVLIIYSRQTHPRNFVVALQHAPVPFALALLAFILVWSVAGLAGFHTYLITHNLTTHEHLRANYGDFFNHQRNPYDFGSVFHNCVYVLCRPNTKSYLRRRKRIHDPNVRDIRPTTVP
ncbi:hypothetical protein BZG36_05528 [Bifiguratus adelaidae]|uniref:Palmitoyltransferase n=1 Tax=Bifiguratus adelaidae TaxID=1938954 RepID=A0A261XSZ3_9FUNG|nr:hypothetical protein BZG36_05528 [Bifiguratus adelaidae]